MMVQQWQGDLAGRQAGGLEAPCFTVMGLWLVWFMARGLPSSQGAQSASQASRGG